MAFNTIVTYAFRIINFLVLIGVAYYLFKKYVLNSIEDTITDQEAYENGLKQQAGSFESRLHEIELEQQSLEDHCTYLKSKVDRWNRQFTATLQKRTQEKDALITKITLHREMQNTIFAQQKLLEQVLPTAIDNAQQRLEAHFSNERENTKYLQQLIAKMSKE